MLSGTAVDAQSMLFLVLGLVLLVGGASLVVDGASRLAASAGVAPLVIGLTVVAFGTSAPELAVSIQSVWSGQGGAAIAVGNVVGSNAFNILCILGISALIRPLVVAQKLVRVDVPLMAGVSLLLLAFAADGALSRWEGLLLLAGMAGYTIVAIVQGRREPEAVREEYARATPRPSVGPRSLIVGAATVAGGLLLLVLGSRWLVDGAVTMARSLGVDELVIGLTIVAAGTSLPELATSATASLRGERDIAVGNVVGSNLFNILGVLGLAVTVAPTRVPVAASAVQFDIPVVIAASIACLPVFFTGYRISRWEGAVFLAYYVLYLVLLVLRATGGERFATLNTAVWVYLVPLGGLTLLVGVARQWRAR